MEVGEELRAPAALSEGKKPRYALDRRVAGLQNRLNFVETRKYHIFRDINKRILYSPLRMK
jgi:hypothetical protein